MTYLLGIDGGGSKTVALVADAAGNILARGVGGTANFQVSGLPAAQAVLEEVAAAAAAAAGIDLAAVGAACLGLAGVDRPQERVSFEAWLTTWLPAATGIVVNDAELVLAAGTPQGYGVALISGTGSICYGRSAAGQMARAGGWGHLLGDEGSGFAMGLAGLRATLRAADGRGPATRLAARILQTWSLARAADLVARVYGRPVPAAEIAQLAVLVEEAAAAGDAVAAAIVREAGAELALAVDAVAAQLDMASAALPCALAGGVLLKGTLVRAAFLAAARARGLQLDPVQSVEEPAWGAVVLARGCLER